MLFKELAKYFEKMEATTSRLEMTYILAELFKKISNEEIDKTLYLLQGRVVPLFEKIEFSMAEKMVIKSIANALNCEKKTFENEYKKIGDLGQTVEKFRFQSQLFDEKKDLTIIEVYNQLLLLAQSGGIGSQNIKSNILAQLIRQLDPISTRYVVRIPIGVMRLGFSDMTILDAFSWMITGDKSLRPYIQEAYHCRPDLGYIGYQLKLYGKNGLAKVKPVVGTPIIMMKAERMSSGEEIIKQIGNCAIQPKYDGLRLQIHYKNSGFRIQNSELSIRQAQDKQLKSQNEEKIKIFSRNLEEVSAMYPDIVEGVKKQIKVDEIIFEGEAIGYDPETNIFLPFQETIQRKRKYDIEAKAKEIPLKLFTFELLYENGINYIKTEYKKRRTELEKCVRISGNINEDTIAITPEKIINDPIQIETEFDEAVAKGLEGIIAKKLDGVYEPGARGWNWIKYKRSYSSKIEDTIDCLVMGYDFGKGKRTDFGIGAFLVGVYDEKQEKFCTMAKIGTGLTDEEWKKLQVKSQKSKIKNKPIEYLIDKAMECDVWIKPKIVMEIKADEISKSPVHTAQYALRFPRLEHFRDDKNPEDITTLKEVEKMYKGQVK
jgi:DNA ligase 1